MRETWLQALRELARGTAGIDAEIYRTFARDPLEPVVGMGDPRARLAIFGRDPGREEVRHQIPFIGAGGQKVRAVLHQAVFERPLDSFQDSVAVGQYVFWANTVPYKPVGNKAWSQAVKKRFQPWMARILLEGWHGNDVVTLGREAFYWFALNQERQSKGGFDDFWRRPDRFQASFPVTFSGPDGQRRRFILHPLPHPSPLNATWYRQFPGLLADRLKQMNFGEARWRLS